MIAVRLMGGLGNQMFQYAFGRALSSQLNTDLVLDTSFLEAPDQPHTYRTYSLDRFNISVPAKKLEYKLSNEPFYYITSLLTRLPVFKYYKEKDYKFDDDVLNSSDKTYFDGYWQSYKYFGNNEAQIRNDFTFKQKNIGRQEILGKIIAGNSVSIHIRRGDYINNRTANEFHGSCSHEYYKNAVGIIKKRVPNAMFFIFSDDPTWVKENMFSGPEFILASDQHQDAHDDLLLMSLCKHAIVANSSFSWWGAWLIKNPDKIVFAPANWFASKSIDTSDLIPGNWQRI